MDPSVHTIKTEKIDVERKSFLFDLKENDRGRFLRITEDVRGRRDTIIVPAPGLEDFLKALQNMIAASHAAGPIPQSSFPDR